MSKFIRQARTLFSCNKCQFTHGYYSSKLSLMFQLNYVLSKYNSILNRKKIIPLQIQRSLLKIIIERIV